MSTSRSLAGIRPRIGALLLTFACVAEPSDVGRSPANPDNPANPDKAAPTALAEGVESEGVKPAASEAVETEPFLMILGIAQDAGYPQAGCEKSCCRLVKGDLGLRRSAASLALVDPETSQRWLFEATPDFPTQLRRLNERFPLQETPGLAGIFLTHAHMGHYTGLMHLGREVMGAQQVPVFTMPRMKQFLSQNGPWSQLVALGNIGLRPLERDQPVRLNDRLQVTPLRVPHRDEFSETVGYLIEGPSRTAFFLPDIDKWERWQTPIESILERIDVAYLDGTFFANGEIPGRDMAQIPHPFMEESLARFSSLGEQERKKIRFIHLNHTNPVLQAGSAARRQVEEMGLGVAVELEEVRL